MTATSRPRRFTWYCGYALVWTVAIVAGGGLVGTIAFPLVGSLAGAGGTAAEMAASGARQLAFLAFVWAPGIAVVMTFHRAYRDRHSDGRSHP